MHARGNEFVYKKFASEIKQKGIDIPIITAEFQGDYFYYKKGKIKDLTLSSGIE